MTLNLLPEYELQRLAALRQLQILDTAAEQSFDDLTALAAFICGTPIALISLVDERRQWFKSKVGLDVTETPRELAFCAHAIAQPDLFTVADAAADARFADNPLVTAEPHIRFYAGAPLVTAEGHALGTLCVIDREPRQLSDAQQQALRALARQALAQIEQRSAAGRLEEANARLRGEAAERAGAERALRESEERYRAITRSATDAIITIDARSQILLANPASERLFGYAPEELVGRPLFTLMPERLRGAHREGVGRYLRTGERRIAWKGVEVPVLHKDGSEVPVEISFGEFGEGDERFFTAVIRDVTERKRAEAELRLRDRAVAAAGSGVTITDATRPGNPLVYVNPAFESITGYAAEEVVGRNCRFLQGPETDPAAVDELRQALREGRHCEVTLRNYRRGGEPFWNRLAVSPVRDESGRLINFIGVQQDVTASLEAEAAARRAEQYRDLFRHANDPLLVLDPEGEVVLDVNDKACEVYGLTREEFLGRSLKGMSRDAARGDEHLRKLLAEGRYDEFESVHLRADGTPIHLLINASLIEHDGRRVVLSINRDITDRKRAEEQLVHNAFHDTLTALPNRALFVDHLHLALERSKRREDDVFAVLFLDLDRFKLVNDSLGHSAGDRLLVLVADRLRGAVRPGDTVARLGGDEFCVLLTGVADAGEAVRIADRIQRALGLPFTVAGQEVFTGASIGISLSSGPGYGAPEQMLRDADAAMYRAKAGGKGRHEVFDPEMHERALGQLQLETDLRRAIERDELFLQYQPIVLLDSGAIGGFEALVRWRHPRRGVVAPGEFIPLAEETGLIVQIGQWVLEQACRQMAGWRKSFGAEAAEWTVSVNLSGRQFQQPDLVEQIRGVLRETGLDATRLKLEITESMLMESGGRVERLLDEMRALGVELSIDDFGTGYSNLSYLHRLPVDWLKIDRSFIKRMADDADNLEIVRTIVVLARSLGMKVVAEGVETERQAEQLRSLSSDCGQGYLFARPMDADEVGELVRKQMLTPA